MTITKTDQMVGLLKSGNTKDALRIAKTFRLGLSPEQKKILITGYECQIYPYIYSQLGKDTKACVKQAVSLLKALYAHKL